jgi:serine/threonine protein kinase
MADDELTDLWIDEIADRFQEAWRAGSRPRIEDYLTGPDETGRATLLVELVCVEVAHRRAAGESPALFDYLVRFPEYAAAVEAGFEAALGPGRMADTQPLPGGVGAQMLLGILALQYNLTDRDALVAAFNTWVGDKARGLGAILVEQGALSAERVALLETLAKEILKQHGGEVRKGLASRGTLDAIRDALEQLHDAELDETLSKASGDSPSEPGAGTTAPGIAGSAAGFQDDGTHSRAEPFRLIKRINRGGQGDIYLAQDEALNRKVALKRIKEEYALIPECQARLLIEAEVAGRLEHPGFLPVHAAGFDPEGRPYFVMRLIAGKSSLKHKIAEFHTRPADAALPGGRVLALETLLRHFNDVCYAVAYAHSRGVLHRDIKPGNVLVGNFGETYLVDWGLVKLVGGATEAEAVLRESLRLSKGSGAAPTVGAVGTLPYMSPEQVSKQALGPATDIYSLGVMLYTLLTGKLAFPDQDDDVTEVDIKAGRFVRPREADGRIPAALEAVCLKAMALRAEDRYGSAKEIAADIEDWQADRPVAVYREPWPRRALRWARNHKPAVASAAVLVFTSLVYLLVNNILIGLERAKTERNFRLARDAVGRLVDLAGVPKSVTLRRAVADTALNSTRAFLESRPRDLRVRFDAARIYHSTADIGRMVGQFDEPLNLYQAAAVLLDQLAGKLSEDEWIQEWAMNTIDTGELFRMNGQLVASKAYFQRPLHVLDQSGDRITESPSRHRVRAIALLKLAQAHNETGDYKEALGAARVASDLLTPLAGQGVDHPGDARFLIMAQNQVGVAERGLKNDRESEKWFSLATQRGQALLDAGQDGPAIKHALACALNNRAELLAADPKREEIEATDEFNRAGLLLISLVDEHPHIPHYKRDLAITDEGRGAIHLAVGRACLPKNPGLAEWNFTRGKHYCEEAAKLLALLQEDHNLADYHRQLDRTFTTLARIAEAQGDSATARTLYERAVREQENARKAPPLSELDRKLRNKAGGE